MTTLLPVIPIANKVRKGDVVALEIEHSETKMHGPTEYYVRFVLATVAHANQRGLATRVMMAGQTHSIEVGRLGKVFALKQYQDAARMLAGLTKYPGTEYETKDALKDAILQHLHPAVQS